MQLRKYEGKDVRVVSVNGLVMEGNVGDYIFADDNEPPVEAIVIDAIKGKKCIGWPGCPVELLATEIKEITLI